jgi:hypothetical protein
MNPSTADENKDDPTIRRCVQFASSWGCGGLCMANLFALRATKPAELFAARDPIGPGNDDWLMKLAASMALLFLTRRFLGGDMHIGYEIFYVKPGEALEKACGVCGTNCDRNEKVYGAAVG